MKTKIYNPSQLEVEIANAIEDLKEDLQERLSNNRIINIENHISKDNPQVRLILEDEDGDRHEVVLKVIQVADKFAD